MPSLFRCRHVSPPGFDYSNGRVEAAKDSCGISEDLWKSFGRYVERNTAT